MKDNKIWYLGYVVALASLIALFFVKKNEVMMIILTAVFAVSLSVTNVKILHHKMLAKDQNYRISHNDERNEKIRDKVNASMSAILILLMGAVAIVCIATKAYLPAILLAVGLAAYPAISYFVNRYYEHKY
ncbi:DUF2178 domain-containing protein [Facklamia languida]|uniref:DUF2178 domain-containing protein n=1 Tax=Facklamia languida CCUG 37842 TaxID=883113 RepID=H3NKH2_9LACT|nr:hypothetical protein [Facklamia languida]EHR36355.1 hypothetical protein HMPREF9708_01361 [Facklamia languida CCUG 37842]